MLGLKLNQTMLVKGATVLVDSRGTFTHICQSFVLEAGIKVMDK